MLGKYTYDHETDTVTLVEGGIRFLRKNKDGSVSSADIVGILTSSANGVDEIQGSTIWTNKDNITAVTGKFSVDANGNVKLDDGAGLIVNQKSVSNIVKNLTDNKGMISKTTADGFSVVALSDLSAESPTETTLFNVARDSENKYRIDIGNLDTEVSTYGTKIDNTTKALNGSGLAVTQDGTNYYIKSIASGLGTDKVTYGDTLFAITKGSDNNYRINIGSLDS